MSATGGYQTTSSTYVKEFGRPERKYVTGGLSGSSSLLAQKGGYEMKRYEERSAMPTYRSHIANGTIPSGLDAGRGTTSYTQRIETTKSTLPVDYKVVREQDYFRSKITDPKLSSSTQLKTTEYRQGSRAAMDFPSEHTHRSFTKLEPLRPLQINRSLSDDKPIGDYLTESLERHRAMQQSQLRENLQVREGDVTVPWDKPHVAPRLDEDRSSNISKLRQELEQWSSEKDREYQYICAGNDRVLSKTLTPAKRDWESDRSYHQRSQSHTNLNAGTNWQFSGGFSPRSVIPINTDQVKAWEPLDSATLQKVVSTVQTHTGGQQTLGSLQSTNVLQPQIQPLLLVPVNTGSLNREVKEERTTTTATSNAGKYTSMPNLADNDAGHGTLIRIKDERTKKPRSVVRTEHRENVREIVPLPRAGPPAIIHGHAGALVPRESVQQNSQTVEETKRTEEIERTVREHRKVKKDKKKSRKEKSHERSGYRNRSLGYRHDEYDDLPWSLPWGQTSHSLSNRAITAGGQQQQYISDGYQRNGDSSYSGGGSKGHHRNRHRMHKSHSSRDVYRDQWPDYNEQHYSPRPIVEFPPTLPRHAAQQRTYGSHQHQYSGSGTTGSVHKSRSFMEDGSATYGTGDRREIKRYETNWPPSSALERDYRENLLMPMPHAGQNMNQREFREQAIPGGHESFGKEVHSNSGTRMGDHNNVTHFNEGKQELNFKRETTSRRR